MSRQTIVKVGSFDNDVANQLNAMFGELYGTAVGGSLANGKILVGDANGLASQVTPTGDVTITNLGVTAIKASVSLTTPVLGVATGTSVNLSGNCRAASFNAGATAGVT